MWIMTWSLFRCAILACRCLQFSYFRNKVTGKCYIVKDSSELVVHVSSVCKKSLVLLTPNFSSHIGHIFDFLEPFSSSISHEGAPVGCSETPSLGSSYTECIF